MAQPIYSFDFDGTLAKIVKQPTEATLSVKTRDLLEKLSHRVPVSIISGRGLSDLRTRVDLRHIYLIGNHGLEGVRNRSSDLRKAREICARWKRDLGELFSIEDKKYTLTVHFRGTRSQKRAQAGIQEVVDCLRPRPRVIGGKCVVNLIPQGAPHKGKALVLLMAHEKKRKAFYIGDDDTDEDVFQLSDKRIFSVRVGKKKTSLARYYIRDQSEMDRLLGILNQFVRAENEMGG